MLSLLNFLQEDGANRQVTWIGVNLKGSSCVGQLQHRRIQLRLFQQLKRALALTVPGEVSNSASDFIQMPCNVCVRAEQNFGRNSQTPLNFLRHLQTLGQAIP